MCLQLGAAGNGADQRQLRDLRIKLDEDVDLEAWWAMRQGLGLDRGEAKAVKREREKL